MEIADGLIAVFMDKKSIKLEKPIYIGQAVLDLSKLLMYGVFYQHLNKYARRWENGSINLLGGDTDSFFLELNNIPLRGFLEKLKRVNMLDTSNYPTSDPLYSRDIASKIGCVKDELAGKVMKEIVLLQPKCYSIITEQDDKTIRRAKGVQRNVITTELNHKEYCKMYKQFSQIFHLNDNPRRRHRQDDNDDEFNPPLVKDSDV